MWSDTLDVVYVAAGLLQLAACGWKLRDLLRDPSDPRLRAITLALLGVAAGFQFAVPRNYTALAASTGIPNLATVCVYFSIVVCTAALQVLACNVDRPRRQARSASRLLTVGTAACLAAMVAAFATAPVEDAPHPVDFDAFYAQVPEVHVVTFLVLYLGAYSLGLVRTALICLRTAPYTRGEPWLRRGVLLVPLGCLFGLGYTAGKVVAIAARWFGFDLDLVNIVLAPASATLGATIMAVGFVLPSVPRARARRDLRPLWKDLRPLDPVLADSTALISADYRVVVAINDLLRLLRPYLSAAVFRLAEDEADKLSLTGDERAAAIDAAQIAVALRAYRDGMRPDGAAMLLREHLDPAAGTADDALVWYTPEHDPERDLAHEQRELARIGRAYKRPHPVVAAVLTETSRPHSSPEPS